MVRWPFYRGTVGSRGGRRSEPPQQEGSRGGGTAVERRLSAGRHELEVCLRVGRGMGGTLTGGASATVMAAVAKY
jgi:hypothetical protein